MYKSSFNKTQVASTIYETIKFASPKRQFIIYLGSTI